MAAVGVSIATIGQYLRPTAEHLPVARWWEPQEFDDLANAVGALASSTCSHHPSRVRATTRVKR